MKKSENKKNREDYNALILKKEKQVGEFVKDQDNVDKVIGKLESDLQSEFYKIELLNHEVSQRGRYECVRNQHKDEEQEQLFKRLLKESKEEISSAYSKERKKLEAEIDALYEKRSEQGWD